MRFKQLSAGLLPIFLLAGASLAAGCSNDLVEGLADGAPPDATVVPAHLVYLVFDGVALTNGTDDPAGNVSGILNIPYTVPAFIADDSQRVARLGLITDAVRSVVAPYNIEVVTERPSSGPYDMIVFGGNSLDAGFSSSFDATIANACDDSGVDTGFIFEFGFFESNRYASKAVAEIGLINGLPYVDVNGDCLCWAGPNCTIDNTICTIGGAGTAVDATLWACREETEFNEHERWLEVFGPAL